MKERYIISDLHFSHKGIIELSKRPFSSVEEMDNILIENWNKVVSPIDRVYLCGDITLNKKSLSLCKNLNGHKVLIKGNHDIYNLKDYTLYFEDIRSYIVEDSLIISHIPILLDQGERFMGNIHGHTHERNISDNRYINISVEQINYSPILLEEVKDKLINKILI